MGICYKYNVYSCGIKKMRLKKNIIVKNNYPNNEFGNSY